MKSRSARLPQQNSACLNPTRQFFEGLVLHILKRAEEVLDKVIRAFGVPDSTVLVRSAEYGRSASTGKGKKHMKHFVKRSL